MIKPFWPLVLVSAGCATAMNPGVAQVLTTSAHTLTLTAHCEEGEVGCSELTASLLDKQTGQVTKLTGFTYMVKCADRVTPCHIGFYDLAAPAISVRAYPDGTLVVQTPDSGSVHEPGTWDH